VRVGSLPDPAVLCGHIAWSKIRKSGGALRGKGIATARLTLGYIGLALGVMGIPLLVGMIQSLREITGTFRSEKQTVVQIGEVGISGNDTNAPRNSTSSVRLFSSYPTASIAEEPSLTVVIQLIDRRGYMR
jgi:hypothetical protein